MSKPLGRIINHNHKDFTCDKCEEEYMIRDDSKLNICFKCELMICDECFLCHMKDNHIKPNQKTYCIDTQFRSECLCLRPYKPEDITLLIRSYGLSLKDVQINEGEIGESEYCYLTYKNNEERDIYIYELKKKGYKEIKSHE